MRRASLHVCDCFTLLEQLPDESIDLVLTDPAYESLEKHRAQGTSTRLKKSKGSSNEWFPIFRNEHFPRLAAEYYRVLKSDRHCYIMCDFTTARVIIPMFEAAGFKFWKPIIWDKVNIGMGYHYRGRYEMVLFFEKGKRRLRDLSVPDVIAAKYIRGGYPTEKPVELLEVFVEQSTEPGHVVLDTFMGSGSAGEAALAHGCSFVGCDVSPIAEGLTIGRLCPFYPVGLHLIVKGQARLF